MTSTLSIRSLPESAWKRGKRRLRFWSYHYGDVGGIINIFWLGGYFSEVAMKNGIQEPHFDNGNVPSDAEKGLKSPLSDGTAEMVLFVTACSDLS